MKPTRQKLYLRPDELRVESFRTDDAPSFVRGTVQGHHHTDEASCEPGCPPPTEDPNHCAWATTDLPTARVDFETNCI
ncbi:MAG: hypothetical protein KY467_05650 [Gemmatimonadetes bacterium]|nr:hypothetical protein [Gemmatimonadota bacterium]